MSNILNYNKK